MKRVVIHADAGPAVGLGHVSRCRRLADAAAALGARCTLQASVAVAGAEAAPFAPEDWPDADLLVIDHYGLDAPMAARAAGRAGVLAVVDDLADRTLAADAVVNPNIYGAGLDYRAWGARAILAGPAYALIDPRFAAAAGRPRGPAAPILLTFGGSDDGSVAAAVAQALLAATDRHLVLIASPMLPPGEAAVALAAARRDRIDLRHGADLAPLMAEAAMLVGGCGTTALEGAAAGLPLVLALTADNQALAARAYAAAGVEVFQAPDPDGMAQAAAALLSPPCHAAPRHAADRAPPLAGLVDGRGAERAMRALLDLAAR